MSFPETGRRRRKSTAADVNPRTGCRRTVTLIDLTQMGIGTPGLGQVSPQDLLGLSVKADTSRLPGFFAVERARGLVR